MKYKLGGTMTKEFAAPRPKLHSYLTDNGCVDKKKKSAKKCFIKQLIKSDDFKKGLENNKTLLRSEQRFRSELPKVFPERVKKYCP